MFIISRHYERFYISHRSFRDDRSFIEIFALLYMIYPFTPTVSLIVNESDMSSPSIYFTKRNITKFITRS